MPRTGLIRLADSCSPTDSRRIGVSFQSYVKASVQRRMV